MKIAGFLIKPKVYLAGQPNKYDNNWKEEFKCLDGFDCYDWEFDSNQRSPDTFFPHDLEAAKKAGFVVKTPQEAREKLKRTALDMEN